MYVINLDLSITNSYLNIFRLSRHHNLRSDAHTPNLRRYVEFTKDYPNYLGKIIVLNLLVLMWIFLKFCVLSSMDICEFMPKYFVLR